LKLDLKSLVLTVTSAMAGETDEAHTVQSVALEQAIHPLKTELQSTQADPVQY
jgi:hypothetical protein